MRSLIDSHFHVFRRGHTQQAGILASPYLQRDFLWDDYLEASSGVDVQASVMVQVNDFTDPLPEAQWVSEVAAANSGPTAIVAYAQLEAPVAAEHIAALRALPLVRGVRRNTQHEADPEFCARPDFIARARLLGEVGLACDICAKAHQLESVIRLAEACPNTSIVLNHFGKPDVTADLSAWRDAMRRLGTHENVSCKVSPVIHTDHDPELTDAIAGQLLTTAIEAFGWDRVMFGSNWPVAPAVIGYLDWVDMLERLLAGERAANLQKLFVENARRVYCLS